MELSKSILTVVKNAASKLTGPKRREFMAKTTIELLDGSPNKAERIFGWGRETVKLGLKELTSGITCVDNYTARGNKKTEEKYSQLEQDIRELVEPFSQADPDFKRPFAYVKLTAKTLRQTLIDKKGYCDEELPAERTFFDILNRLGYTLKRVEKTKPVKKIPEVDEIFENVHKVNKESDDNPESLRISIDTKAKVKVGEFSRNGKSRGHQAEKAADHDMGTKEQLVPESILAVVSGLLTLVFCKNTETTDFIIDALELWWEENKEQYSHIKELVINLDNGPHIKSNRTQFVSELLNFLI